jgi:hypothetical protein
MTWLRQMRPIDGALLVRDYPGEVVRITCTRCSRVGCYRLARLIERRAEALCKEKAAPWLGSGRSLESIAMKSKLPQEGAPHPTYVRRLDFSDSDSLPTSA